MYLKFEILLMFLPNRLNLKNLMYHLFPKFLMNHLNLMFLKNLKNHLNLMYR